MSTMIPLMGKQPDVVNALAGGARAAGVANQVQHSNRLRDLYASQGAGILAGDPSAMNALAGLDPAQAHTMQMDRQNQQRADDRLAISQEQLQMQRDAVARALAEAEDQTEAQREAQEAVAMGNKAMAALQAGDERAWGMMTREFTDGTPLPMTREGVATLQSIVTGSADYMAALPQQQKPADEYQRYVQEEQQAGRQPLSRIEYAQAKKGSEVIYGPDGRPILERGPAGSVGKLTELQSKNAVFATRAKGALNQLMQEADGEPLANQMSSRVNRGLEVVPFGLGRELQNSEFQVAAAAGQEFLQAILRKDTGAAITDQEQILYGRLYLPQPGDSPEVLAYRDQARQRAVAAIEAGMTPEAMRAQEIALAEQAGVTTFGEDASSGDWTDIGDGYRIRSKQ